MAKITFEQLKNKKACTQQVELFEKLFGESVEVTTDLAVEMAGKFDWNWAARKLLSNEGWKIYDDAIAPDQKIYYESVDAAWKIYDEATISPVKIYNESIDAAWKIYDEAIDAAWKIYDEAMATAFVEIYNKEND